MDGSAILFYGYCWDEETDSPWMIGREDADDHPNEDWETRYARVQGVIEPSSPYPRGTPSPYPYGTHNAYTQIEQTVVDEYRAYHEQKYKLANASHCRIYTRGFDEHPRPYVCVKASVIDSCHGLKTEIRSLVVAPEWDGQLAAFCEMLGIQINGIRPSWWLVSDA